MREGTIKARPEWRRLPLEFFQAHLAELASSEQFCVLVASCPSRLGDNTQVMEQVEAMATDVPWKGAVDFVFSRAGSAASNLFPNY